MRRYYDGVRAAGDFHSLGYWCPAVWGSAINVSIDWPPPDPKACGGPRPGGLPSPCPTFDGANAYLQHVLQPAMLRRGWDFDHPSYLSNNSIP